MLVRASSGSGGGGSNPIVILKTLSITENVESEITVSELSSIKMVASNSYPLVCGIDTNGDKQYMAGSGSPTTTRPSLYVDITDTNKVAIKYDETRSMALIICGTPT